MNKRKELIPALLFALILALPSAAQTTVINSDLIKTVELTVNDRWDAAPIITLNSTDFLTLSFDELTHQYTRFTYTLTHHNADWQPSQLFEIDYMNGFNGQPIEQYENSINTTMDYTRYTLTLPNEDVQMKVSGNYKLSVYRDESDTPAFVVCFSVVEPMVGINLSVSSSTDIDTNKSHQQVSFTINTGGYSIATPQTELTALVYQNRRPDNCVTIQEPTYITAYQLQYVHNKKLIFDAGNEYRRFEIINVYNPSMNVESIRFFDPYFHAFLYQDKIRRTYSYDEDQNGRFLIRSDAAYDVNTEADYLFIHYSLKMPQLPAGGELYIAGDFTGYRFVPQYKMSYNTLTEAYETIQLQKQGAYNYMYLWVPSGSTRGDTGPCGGNFYETENEYMVMLYHRPFGGRYDKLIGVNQIKFTQESNGI